MFSSFDFKYFINFYVMYNFNDLRQKLDVLLPNTNKVITVIEPVAKQRLGFLNKLIALNTRGDVTQENINEKIQELVYETLINYIKQNVNTKDEMDIMLYDANDMLVFALTLIEFMANNWFVNAEKECMHCKHNNKFRLVFEPGVLQNPSMSYTDRIMSIKQTFEIEDSNFIPLYAYLPEKTLEPRKIEKPIGNDFILTMDIYYPLLQFIHDSIVHKDITLSNLAYLHSCKITNKDNTKILLAYNAFIKIHNKTSTELVKQLNELPESIYKTIQQEINKYADYYQKEHNISFKYNFVCSNCGKENKEVEFNITEHFFGYLVGATI